MWIMAINEEDKVIVKILRHLKLWDPRPPSQAPPPEEEGDCPVNSQIPLVVLAHPSAHDISASKRVTYYPLPDIA